jgi:hypothetical protein
VSGDVPHFSIDMASQEPDFWQARWRADLPEPIPAAVLSNAEAMSRFQGCMLCPLQLQLISPDDSPTHYAEDISSPHASRVPYCQCRTLMATCLTINRSQLIMYMGNSYRPTLLPANAVFSQYSLWLLTLPGHLTRDGLAICPDRGLPRCLMRERSL